LALDAIDFSYLKEYKTKYTIEKNKSSEIVSCNYFTTNILEFDKTIEKDYFQLDSFVIYIAIEGDFELEKEEHREQVRKGETVLVPAETNTIQLKPLSGTVKLLEVYIK
jgi:mannose-6-phosphate isomerase